MRNFKMVEDVFALSKCSHTTAVNHKTGMLALPSLNIVFNKFLTGVNFSRIYALPNSTEVW